MRKIEEARTAGLVGSSLQAEIVAVVSMEDKVLLKSLQDDLRFVLITSAASVSDETDEGMNEIIVKPSAHPKCERCWHYRADVGRTPNIPPSAGVA